MTMSFIVSTLLTIVNGLIAMSFYTLLERKALGYFQIRKGPNKVSIMGIPQPFADAIKLFSKERVTPMFSNLAPFYFAPMVSLSLALILWTLYPHSSPSWMSPYSAILFLAISSLSVFTTLAAGWSSNSKYALLGALRSIAQTISYEISMSLIFLSIIMIHYSFNMNMFYKSMLSLPLLMMPLIVFIWFVTTLAETNRTPFDFAEGESELVSGFNTEFSSAIFALIFMAEYSSILIMSIFTAMLFTKIFLFNTLFFILAPLQAMFFAFLFIWARATFPRMRYDRLMSLTWKSYLPFSLSFLVFTIPMMMIF